MAEMADAGASLEHIRIAVRYLECEQSKDADRRAKRSAQKQKERDLEKESRATVARQDSDNAATVAPVSQIVADEPRAVIPPEHTHASACVFPVGMFNNIPLEDTPLPSVGPQAEKPKRHSGSCLPKDWSPSESLFAYGRQQGLDDSHTAEILENMRLWAHSNANRAIARKADWEGTMQGAIRRDAAKFKARAGPTKEKFRNGHMELMINDIRKQHDAINGNGDMRAILDVEVLLGKKEPTMPNGSKINAFDDAEAGRDAGVSGLNGGILPFGPRGFIR